MTIVAKINMTRAIKRMGEVSGVVIERQSVGVLINGRYTPGAVTTITVTAAMQPLGEARELLPAGERTKNGWKMFSASAVRPVQRAAGTPGDIVLWQGVRYEVVYLDDWDSNGKYWRALIVKVDQ